MKLYEIQCRDLQRFGCMCRIGQPVTVHVLTSNTRNNIASFSPAYILKRNDAYAYEIIWDNSSSSRSSLLGKREHVATTRIKYVKSEKYKRAHPRPPNSDEIPESGRGWIEKRPLKVSKLRSLMSRAKRRFFIVDFKKKTMSYYCTPELKVMKGTFNLEGARCLTVPDDSRCSFQLHTTKKGHLLTCKTSASATAWQRCLADTIVGRHPKQSGTHAAAKVAAIATTTPKRQSHSKPVYKPIIPRRGQHVDVTGTAATKKPPPIPPSSSKPPPPSLPSCPKPRKPLPSEYCVASPTPVSDPPERQERSASAPATVPKRQKKAPPPVAPSPPQSRKAAPPAVAPRPPRGQKIPVPPLPREGAAQSTAVTSTPMPRNQPQVQERPKPQVQERPTKRQLDLRSRFEFAQGLVGNGNASAVVMHRRVLDDRMKELGGAHNDTYEVSGV